MKKFLTIREAKGTKIRKVRGGGKITFGRPTNMVLLFSNLDN